MNIGRMDRLVRLESPPTAQNAAGEVELTGSWPLFARAKASKRDTGGREIIQGGASMAIADATYVIWYLPGLNTTHRLVDEDSGEVYDVLNIKELGRREGMELLCKRRGQ